MKALLSLIALSLFSQAHAYDLSQKFGIGAGVGYAIPVFGNQFNSVADPDWNMSLYGRYHLNPFWAIDLGVSKSEFTYTTMNLRNINLIGNWRMAGAANLTPIVGIGLGLTDIKDYNPGSAKLSLLARAGVDYGFSECLSLSGLVDYQYVSKFMGDMPGSRAHVVIPQLALNFYFGGSKEDKTEKPVVEQPVTTSASSVSRIDENAMMVEFDTMKAAIKSSYTDKIKAVAERMKSDNSLVGVIEGRADSTGSDQLNMKLSELRAMNVKKKLVEFGVNEERIKIQAMGESNPIADNKTKEGRQHNRSAAVNITNQSALM